MDPKVSEFDLAKAIIEEEVKVEKKKVEPKKPDAPSA